MRKLTGFVLAASLLLSSGSAWAEGFEVIPFAGYRFGGGLSSLSGVQKFDTEDTFSFGAALDYVLQSNDAVEVYWGHFSGDAEATLATGPEDHVDPQSRRRHAERDLVPGQRAQPDAAVLLARTRRLDHQR